MSFMVQNYCFFLLYWHLLSKICIFHVVIIKFSIFIYTFVSKQIGSGGLRHTQHPKTTVARFIHLSAEAGGIRYSSKLTIKLHFYIYRLTFIKS